MGGQFVKTSFCPTCLNTGVNYREYEGVREIEGPCRTCGGKQTNVEACEADDDDTVYCGRCGEEGHSYSQCWSYDSMEGDR